MGRKLSAIKTKLGGVTAYLFSALPRDVLRIAFVNHRDLRDPSGAPSYQRVIKPGRLKQIGHFLDQGGFFPNTILLNFHRKPRFEQVARDSESGICFGNLILPDKYKSCWVIDGQHRLYGTTATEEGYQQPLFFLAFDRVTASQEANIFVEINAKQATVSPTLLSALDGEVKWDSDDPKERLAAIASRAVDLLNTQGGGPLEGKVVSPGITAGTSQPLNLRSLQERVRLAELLGTVNGQTGEIIPGPCWGGNSKDSLERLVSLLELHMDTVREANPDRWEAGRPGALCSNLGVGSQIRLLSEAISFVAYRDNIKPSAEEISDLYQRVRPLLKRMFDFVNQEQDEQFKQRFTVIFGSSGYHEYFFKLYDIVASDLPGHEPEGYFDFLATTTQDLTDLADRQVKWIQAVVPTHVKEQCRAKFGENYFEEVIPKDIQKTCQTKRIDDESADRLAVEDYLDWIQLAKVCAVNGIKKELKPALSIRLPNDPNGSDFYRSWFEALNRIRRIAAHPAGRSYKTADIEVLSIVVDHLQSNLPDHLAEGAPDAPVS